MGERRLQSLARSALVSESTAPRLAKLVSLKLEAVETIATTDLKGLAADVLGRALKAGATDAEVVVYDGDEFSTHVRLGQVETLKESGSRAIGLRVYIAS